MGLDLVVWIMGTKMDRRFRKGARLSAPIYQAMCQRVCEINMGFRIAVSKDLGARVTDDVTGIAARFYNGEGPHDCRSVISQLNSIGGGAGTELTTFSGSPRFVLRMTLAWMANYRIDECVNSDNVLTAYEADMRRGVVA